MKKNLIVTLIILVFIALFIGGTYMFSRIEGSLELKAIAASINNGKGSFKLSNKSKDIYMYNSEYKLELLLDGIWVDIPYVVEYPLFTSEAILIRPQTTIDIMIEWRGYYGELSAGEYRIVKKLYKKLTDYKHGDPLILYAQFTIS